MIKMEDKKTIDDKVEDVEVTEQEFNLYLNNLLSAAYKKYTGVIDIAQSVRTYKALNFKIKYFYSEKEGSYYFTFIDKEKAGFKK